MALVVVTGIVLVKLLVIKIPTIGGIFVFVEIIGQAQFQFAVFRKRMFVIQTCGKNVAPVLVEGFEGVAKFHQDHLDGCEKGNVESYAENRRSVFGNEGATD